MAKQKGAPKTGGRKKGTPNQTTQLTRQYVAELAEGLIPRVLEELAKLEGKEFLQVWLKLAEFNIPKPTSVSIDMAAGNELTSLETKLVSLSKIPT